MPQIARSPGLRSKTRPARYQPSAITIAVLATNAASGRASNPASEVLTSRTNSAAGIATWKTYQPSMATGRSPSSRKRRAAWPAAANSQIGAKALRIAIRPSLTPNGQAAPPSHQAARLGGVDLIDPADQGLPRVLVAQAGGEQPVLVDRDLEIGPGAAVGQPVLVRVEQLVQPREHDGAGGHGGGRGRAHLERGHDRGARGREQDEDFVDLVGPV